MSAKRCPYCGHGVWPCLSYSTSGNTCTRKRTHKAGDLGPGDNGDHVCCHHGKHEIERWKRYAKGEQQPRYHGIGNLHLRGAAVVDCRRAAEGA